jgi:hypothetical protein
VSNLLFAGVEAFGRRDYRQALDLFGQLLAVSHTNLAVTKERLGLPGVEEHYRAALDANPGEHAAAFGLSHCLLRKGQFEEGWRLHERRRLDAKLGLPKIPADWPEYLGGPLDGRRLAIISEQGFGDQIMFARFVPAVRARGGEPVLYHPPELTRLLGGSSVVRRAEFDLWCFQQSLPHLLGVNLDNLPAPAAMPIAWRGGGGIGVVPTGKATYAEDQARSLAPDQVDELLALGRDLRPEATGARDFHDTAEILAGLDLVISVDTSVAHLAGSMGVPTWIVLPSPFADWRWMEGIDHSPWYPSVRLFRQIEPGDWGGVLRRVHEALEARP